MPLPLEPTKQEINELKGRIDAERLDLKKHSRAVNGDCILHMVFLAFTERAHVENPDELCGALTIAIWSKFDESFIDILCVGDDFSQSNILVMSTSETSFVDVLENTDFRIGPYKFIVGYDKQPMPENIVGSNKSEICLTFLVSNDGENWLRLFLPTG